MAEGVEYFVGRDSELVNFPRIFINGSYIRVSLKVRNEFEKTIDI